MPNCQKAFVFQCNLVVVVITALILSNRVYVYSQEQVRKVQRECQQKIKNRETAMLDLQNMMGSVKVSFDL